MQSGISIAALLLMIFWNKAIKLSPFWYMKKPKKLYKNHSQSLVTGMVEFQKAQCYFAFVVQIAGLIYAHSGDLSLDADVILLAMASTIGLTPVVFNMQNIMRFGRPSWYILSMTILSWVLSTALLSWTTILLKSTRPNYNENVIYPSCAWSNGFKLSSTLSICNNQPYSAIDSPIYLALLWGAWAVSACWLPEIIRHFIRGTSEYSKNISTAPQRLGSKKSFQNRKPSFSIFVFTASWSFAFGSQYFIFYQYFSHSAFSSENWGFGQVIAVTIWIPCLIEYLYLEFRKLASIPRLHLVQSPTFFHIPTNIISGGMAKGSEYRLASPLIVVEKSEPDAGGDVYALVQGAQPPGRSSSKMSAREPVLESIDLSVSAKDSKYDPVEEYTGARQRIGLSQ